MKLLRAMAVLLISVASSIPCFAIDPDELPFGLLYMDSFYTSSDLARLDSLCFNHFIEYRNILNN
jgi:hypothetical protein